MRVILACLLFFYIELTFAQPLKSVSNADNDLQKHQQVLASRLLSWSTGSEEQINYVSVGRYANYFGFVKLRVSSAHSLKRSEVGRESLSVLTDAQLQILIDTLKEQEPLIQATHAARLEANGVLQTLLNNAARDDIKTRFTDLAVS